MAHRTTGPNGRATRARARGERGLVAGGLLFVCPPPFEGYERWLTPGPDGRLELEAAAPKETRVWAGQMALLFPLYHGRLPWAAAQLDRAIRQDSVFIAGPDGRERHASVASVAARLDTDGHSDERGGVCPRISCAGGGHDLAEHRVWLHTHHLHAAGLLVIDEIGSVHHATPPHRPGDSWQLTDRPPPGQSCHCPSARGQRR